VARDLASVWHPFTQHALWAGDDPLVIDRAEGVWLYDSDGARYLDGVSSLWVTVHGHREPAINEAIRAQLDRLDHATFLGLTHEPGIALAEALLAGAPSGLSRVFYAGDGASAVEAALKMAFQFAAQRGESRPLFLSVAEGTTATRWGSQRRRDRAVLRHLPADPAGDQADPLTRSRRRLSLPACGRLVRRAGPGDGARG
jgi:Adenosylmethionine-8-amino-7-oxononanoate aminotransferase